MSLVLDEEYTHVIQNFELIEKVKEYAIKSEPNYQDNYRGKKEKLLHITRGKLIEFAIHQTFLKGSYTEPSLEIHQYDDGGFDSKHLLTGAKIDYKIRRQDYINLRHNSLRSDIYVIVKDVKINQESGEIRFSEPVFYAAKDMEKYIQQSFNIQKKQYWPYFIWKKDLTEISLFDITHNSDTFIRQK